MLTFFSGKTYSSCCLALVAALLFTYFTQSPTRWTVSDNRSQYSQPQLALRTPLISVIIPYYNPKESWFNETLTSLYQQSLNNWELLIVNDASSKEMAPRISFAKVPFFLQNNIRVIHHEVNQGLSCSRNTGVLNAKAPFVLFLDPDDLLNPLALEKLLLYAVGYLHKPVPHFPGYQYGFVYSGVHHFGSLNATVYADYDANRLLQENYLTSTALISREMYLKIGGMCPRSIVKYFEDYDFWTRALSLGYQGKLLLEPLFYYRRHSDGQSTTLIENVQQEEWKGEIKKNNPVAFKSLSREMACQILQARKKEGTVFPCYGTVKTESLSSFFETILNRVQSRGSYKKEEKFKGCEPVKPLDRSLTVSRLPRDHLQFHETRYPRETRIIRVLYLLPWMVIGGADLYDLSVIKSLKSQALSMKSQVKYHVTLVVARHIPVHPWEPLFRSFVDEIFHLQRLSNDSLVQQEILEYLIESRNVELVMNSRTVAGYTAFEQWSTFGTKLVQKKVKKVDILHLFEPWSRHGWEWRAARSSSNLDKRVVVSRDLKNYLIETVGKGDTTLGKPSSYRPLSPDLEEKIQVIYPPLDLQGFYQTYPCQATLDCFQSKSTQSTLLFVGRLDTQKLPFLFLDVASLVSKPRVKIWGQGPLSGWVKQQVYKQEQYKTLAPRIDWKGGIPQHKVPEALLESSQAVFLLTSSHEGVPIVVIEALGVGVPVVTMQCGGIEEVLLDSQVWSLNSSQREQKGKMEQSYTITRLSYASLIHVNCLLLHNPSNIVLQQDITNIMKQEVEYWFQRLEIETENQKTRWKSAQAFRTKYSSSAFEKTWRETIDALIS